MNLEMAWVAPALLIGLGALIKVAQWRQRAADRAKKHAAVA